MSDTGSGDNIYQFGQFTLDERRAELASRTGRIPLRPQSFEVLHLLVANHGRLITKEELHATIWRDRAVTDDSLAQCLSDIRQAIGDSRRKIVRTVPRRGYLFAGEVVVISGNEPLSEAASAKRWRDHSLIAAALGAALLIIGVLWVLDRGAMSPRSGHIENSVAVLPFVDMSVRQDQQYLGDGLSEDILSSLGKYAELRVIARTSSFSLAGRSVDVLQIRDALNVAYVVEGSIRRTGDHVRVVAQLIDATDSTQIWSDTYEISAQELFTIHHLIAGRVAQRIVPDLPILAAEPRQRNFTTSDLMWLARRFENEVKGNVQVDRVALDKAIRLYREATLADPNSALAHSRLAGALLYGGDVPGAQTVIFRARELDPDLSDVQETLGTLYFALNRTDEAGAAWKRAIDLNPSNVDALGAYATWYWLQRGDGDPAEYYRRALELDPLNLARYADLGFFLGSNSRIQEITDVLQQVEKRFDGPEAYHVIALLLNFTGRIDESIAWTIRARDAEPHNVLHVAALAELFIDVGDYETALALQPQPGIGALLKMRLYEELIYEAELLMIDQPDDVHLRYLLAFAYNAVGRSGDAVRLFGDLGMLDLSPLRQVIDFGARVTLAEALEATGNTDAARANANWWLENVDLKGNDWWKSIYGACTLAILGEDEKARDWLEEVPKSTRLPWIYLLRDSICFRRFSDDKRYRQVLEDVDARLAVIREQLPNTLEEFGVEL